MYQNTYLKTVDLIQVDSLMAGLEAGVAPSANDFTYSAAQGLESLINVSSASNLLDDEAIMLDNFTLKTFDNTHFASIELVQHQLAVTPTHSF